MLRRNRKRRNTEQRNDGTAAVGNEVDAMWDGDGQWYPAVVTAVSSDDKNECTVRFTEDEIVQVTSAEKIRQRSDSEKAGLPVHAGRGTGTDSGVGGGAGSGGIGSEKRGSGRRKRQRDGDWCQHELLSALAQPPPPLPSSSSGGDGSDWSMSSVGPKPKRYRTQAEEIDEELGIEASSLPLTSAPAPPQIGFGL